jgi:hypothetical protein
MHGVDVGLVCAISTRAFRGLAMAPRWIKTKDYNPSKFLPISEDDDWRLAECYSGFAEAEERYAAKRSLAGKSA